MKKNDIVKEEMHKVFKREMFQENKAYKLIDEEDGRELFVGILTCWTPTKISFVVPLNSYYAQFFPTLVDKRIDDSLAIIAFYPNFLEDKYSLELLK